MNKLSDMPTDFVYCDNRKCGHKECLRRYTNAQWNVYIRIDRYQPDKDGNCKYEVKE